MKKEILEALAARFEGVSSAVLDRIANKLAKTITKTEDIATAVEGGDNPTNHRQLYRQPGYRGIRDRSQERSQRLRK